MDMKIESLVTLGKKLIRLASVCCLYHVDSIAAVCMLLIISIDFDTSDFRRAGLSTVWPSF